MASQTISIESGVESVRSRVRFYGGGGTGLSSVPYNNGSLHNQLLTVQRTGIQQHDLIDGDPYFTLTSSMKEIATMTAPTRITSFSVTYRWSGATDNNWYWMGESATYSLAQLNHPVNWLGDTTPASTLGRSQLILPDTTSPHYSPVLPVSYNGDFYPVYKDWDGLNITYKNMGRLGINTTFNFDLSEVDFLSEDTFTLKQPICPRIPAFQHSYDFWPFNAGKKMLWLQWWLYSIKFDFTYDIISEYRGIFYSPQQTLTPGTTLLYKDQKFTTLLSPNGYVSDGTYFYYVLNGLVTNVKKCQNNLNVGLSGNGTVSSAYPYSTSGSGTYSFDQDVTYITLQASATYGDSLVTWRVVDFSGNSTDLSPTSSINIYNGDYESVTAIYTSSGSSPTCYRYNVTYTAFITYFPCGEAETSTQFFSGDSFCAESVTGGATTLLPGMCNEYV
jgi:hypothetical protein